MVEAETVKTRHNKLVLFCFTNDVYSKCSSGAAFSSILTCPLAASLTADSVLKFKPGKLEAGVGAGSGAGTRQMPRLYYLGLMLVMVAVSAAVISCNGEQLYDTRDPVTNFAPSVVDVVVLLCCSGPDLRHPDRTGVQRLPAAAVRQLPPALPQ